MTNEKAVELLLEKRRELQSFIDITPKPEETYPHMVEFCEALDMAAAALQQDDGPTFLYLDDPEAVAMIKELTERMMHDGLVKICEVTGSGENEPQTNADAIRAMSDEELAEHLNDWQDWGGGLSTEMWLDWLRQPKEATL